MSAPRSAVVETLDDLGCSVTAKEIADSLHRRGQDVGVASIYRTLELLDKLRLTRRVDAAEGVALDDPDRASAVERLARRSDRASDALGVQRPGQCTTRPRHSSPATQA